MEINNINNSIAYCEAKGMSKVLMAYANECPSEEIMEMGFNPNSGYIYIALENGISICSCLGSDVEYLVTDFEDGEEYFLDTYEEAITKYESIS
jgi:hypothetical protein